MTASFAGLDAALRLREWMLKEMFDVFAIWNSNGWFPAGKGGVPAIAKALRTYAPVYGTPMYTLGGCNIATGAASPQGYAVAGLNFGQQYQNVGAGLGTRDRRLRRHAAVDFETDGAAAAVDAVAHGAQLVERAGNELLAAETRVHRHDQHHL